MYNTTAWWVIGLVTKKTPENCSQTTLLLVSKSSAFAVCKIQLLRDLEFDLVTVQVLYTWHFVGQHFDQVWRL